MYLPSQAFAVLFTTLLPYLSTGQVRKPHFQDYPPTIPYTGPRAPLKLHPASDAWMYRTRIREAARHKPNFAGHYILASWGCGAECLESVIIDARTGEVYLVDFTTCCWFPCCGEAADVPDTFAPVDFRLTSKLLIFTGLRNEEGSRGTHYYKFQGGQLIELR